MNEHDSGRMASQLVRMGYALTDDVNEAELVLINTCSVRENPENKVFSLLGRLSRLKRKRPNLVIGVAGCVAQQEGEKILERVDAVDMVFGPDAIFQLQKMVEAVLDGNRVLNTQWLPRDKKIQNFIPESELAFGTVANCKGLIAITKGCDNFCSFCIVPLTRGRLVSRDKASILEEAKQLIADGAKELQLLGQNVNSYRAAHSDFHDLLKSVADLNGLNRLRFTSPHPNDWDNRLSDLMADHPVICNHIHLPFQSGADQILDKMRRGHRASEYLEKIEYLKAKIPTISITTDVIVGFPGETETDFQATLSIIESVRFSLIYAFKYSERPGTRAVSYEDDVPREVKEERLARLHDLQNPIQSTILDDLVGTEQEVLVENVHPKESNTVIGRTEGHFSVSLPGDDSTIGSLLKVKITGRKKHSLVGQVLG